MKSKIFLMLACSLVAGILNAKTYDVKFQEARDYPSLFEKSETATKEALQKLETQGMLETIFEVNIQPGESVPFERLKKINTNECESDYADCLPCSTNAFNGNALKFGDTAKIDIEHAQEEDTLIVNISYTNKKHCASKELAEEGMPDGHLSPEFVSNTFAGVKKIKLNTPTQFFYFEELRPYPESELGKGAVKTNWYKRIAKHYIVTISETKIAKP